MKEFRYFTNSFPRDYVFGPLGSGSVITCTDPDLDPGPSINKQKKFIKTLISAVRIQGSGFVSKCHGYGTCLEAAIYHIL
jgi:hypothetical protein